MWTCAACRETHGDDFDSCWKCGAVRGQAVATRITEASESEQSMGTAHQGSTVGPLTGWILLFRFFGVLSLLWTMYLAVRTHRTVDDLTLTVFAALPPLAIALGQFFLAAVLQTGDECVLLLRQVVANTAHQPSSIPRG